MVPGAPARTLNLVMTPLLGDFRLPPAKPVSELTSTRVHGLETVGPPSSLQVCGGAELSGCLFSFAPNLKAGLMAGKTRSPVAASATGSAIRFIVLSLHVVGAGVSITLDSVSALMGLLDRLRREREPVQTTVAGTLQGDARAMRT